MRAMHAVMSTQTPTAARSPERSRLARPVRAAPAAATAPHTARARAATVAPYPSSGIISVASPGTVPSSRLRCAMPSAGLCPSSGAFLAQALDQFLVPGLRAVVGRLVLLRVLGED